MVIQEMNTTCHNVKSMLELEAQSVMLHYILLKPLLREYIKSFSEYLFSISV